jgi:hypothetical protein
LTGKRSRRPITVKRTPSSMQWDVSVSKYSCRSLKIPAISGVGLCQFAEESANNVKV